MISIDRRVSVSQLLPLSINISSGYRFTMGLEVYSQLLVCIFATRVSPSMPVISSSITASFHLVLGKSS